jgi:hypothetical protein
MDVWDLAPGIFRKSIRSRVAPAMNGLELERHLYQDFAVKSAGLRTSRQDSEDVYILQQHYGMPTRLLDWTYNALAALFFAVEKRGDYDEKDGRIYVMDTYRLWEQQPECAVRDPPFRGVATSKHRVFSGAVKVIAEWHDPKNMPDYVFPIRPNFFDSRISLQRSCFTFHVEGKEILTTAYNDSLKVYQIPKASKPAIRQELTHLGIDYFSVFGDLPSLSRTLQEQYNLYPSS